MTGRDAGAASLVDRMQSGSAVAAREWLETLDETNRAMLVALLRSRTDARFGKVLETYVPGAPFPAISVTGTRCDLGCKHCNKKYLEGMLPARTPPELERVLLDLHAAGGKGALISGGSSVDGIVEMERFHPVLESIKARTSLALNMHVGLIDRDTATRLRATGVDVISLDLVGDDATIHDVYGLDKTAADYRRVLQDMMAAGFTREQIVPHVCIGLHHGELAGECTVLDWLQELDPALIVFIVIIPPASDRTFTTIPPADVSSVVATARARFPDAGISLGCMRPGGRARAAIDVAAFEAGITRVAVPSGALLKHARERGYEVRRIDTCCAVHRGGSMELHP